MTLTAESSEPTRNEDKNKLNAPRRSRRQQFRCHSNKQFYNSGEVVTNSICR